MKKTDLASLALTASLSLGSLVSPAAALAQTPATGTGQTTTITPLPTELSPTPTFTTTITPTISDSAAAGDTQGTGIDSRWLFGLIGVILLFIILAASRGRWRRPPTTTNYHELDPRLRRTYRNNPETDVESTDLPPKDDPFR